MMAGFQTQIIGMIGNTKTLETQTSHLVIHYTDDSFGKTISVGSIQTGIQYTFPFDELLKSIKGLEVLE